MTALSMRLARSFDGAGPGEAGFSRSLTPTAKFGICKAAPRLIYELMECLGGNGYVEESPLPRLYREAPVNAIWEGSGNVIALDILRTESREPEVAAAALTSLMTGIEELPGARDAASEVLQALRSPEAESRARFIADRLYALAAASALAASAPPAVAEAWARTRLVGPPGIPGSSDLGTATGVLLERAFPPI